MLGRWLADHSASLANSSLTSALKPPPTPLAYSLAGAVPKPRKHHTSDPLLISTSLVAWPPWRGGGVNFISECPKPRVNSFRRTYPPLIFDFFFIFASFLGHFFQIDGFSVTPVRKSQKKTFSPVIWRSLFGCILSILKKNVNFFLYSAIVVFWCFLIERKKRTWNCGGGGRQNWPFCRVSAKISTRPPPLTISFCILLLFLDC